MSIIDDIRKRYQQVANPVSQRLSGIVRGASDRYNPFDRDYQRNFNRQVVQPVKRVVTQPSVRQNLYESSARWEPKTPVIKQGYNFLVAPTIFGDTSPQRRMEKIALDKQVEDVAKRNNLPLFSSGLLVKKYGASIPASIAAREKSGGKISDQDKGILNEYTKRYGESEVMDIAGISGGIGKVPKKSVGKVDVPATQFGKKSLDNSNPLLDDFVSWFKEQNGGSYKGYKLSTYTDGEPYFGGAGGEVSLRDYLSSIRNNGTKPLSQPTIGAKGTKAPVSLTKSTKLQTLSPQDTKNLAKKSSSLTNYNTNRLNITAKNKQAIETEISKSAKLAEEVVGKKLSNKEVVDLANNTSAVLNRKVTKEATAAKIASNLNLRRKIAASVKDGKVDKDFVDLWIKDKSAGEDIARQLQARRIGADPKEIDMINVMLDSIYKVNKNADEIAKAAKGVDFNNLEQATNFYRKFVKPKKSEWFDLLRYNSMLSNPNTHIVNTASNFEGTGLIAPIEKTITGTVDAMRSALTGQPRKFVAGEGIEYAKGYYSNISKAAKRFMDVITSKELVTQPDIRNIPLATKGSKKITEKILAFPLKALDGMDKFFMTMTEGGTERALALRAKKGINVADSAGEASREATYRLFRETKNADQGYVLDAIDQVTNTIMNLRNSNNPVVATISKMTLPFVRTPMNLFKQGIEYSPFGLVTMAGNKRKAEQLSKIIIGMASATAAATLLGQDRLTWAEPIDPDQRNAFRAAGKQPYAVKIGNHWVGYAKLHPAIAANLSTIAAVDDALKSKRINQSTADAVLTGLSKYGTYLADQSYAKNIGDLLGAIKGGPEKAAQFVGNYPNQIVPLRGLMTWLGRIQDPLERQINTDASIIEKQMQNFLKDLPFGLSEKVPARLGPTGEPIPRQYPVINALSPNRITKENPEFSQMYDMQIEQKKFNQMKSDVKKMAESGDPSKIKSEDLKKKYEEDKFNFEMENAPVGTRKEFNGKIYKKTEDGIRKVSISDMNKKVADYKLTQDIATAKEMNDIGTWWKLSEQKIKNIQQENTELDSELDAVQIARNEQAIENIIKNMAKYKSYGGFKKPKKAKIAKPKKPKTIALKASKGLKEVKMKLPTDVSLKGGQSGTKPRIARLRTKSYAA